MGPTCETKGRSRIGPCPETVRNSRTMHGSQGSWFPRWDPAPPQPKSATWGGPHMKILRAIRIPPRSQKLNSTVVLDPRAPTYTSRGGSGSCLWKQNWGPQSVSSPPSHEMESIVTSSINMHEVPSMHPSSRRYLRDFMDARPGHPLSYVTLRPCFLSMTMSSQIYESVWKN